MVQASDCRIGIGRGEGKGKRRPGLVRLENQLETDKRNQSVDRSVPVNPPRPFISWPSPSQLLLDGQMQSQMARTIPAMDTVRNCIQYTHPFTRTSTHTSTHTYIHPTYRYRIKRSPTHSPTAIHSYRLVLTVISHRFSRTPAENVQID